MYNVHGKFTTYIDCCAKKKNSAWISRRLFLIYAVFLSNLFVQCSFMLIMSKRHWQTAYNRKENFNNFSHAHKEKLYIFHGNLISCTIWWQLIKWIQLLARWKNKTIHGEKHWPNWMNIGFTKSMKCISFESWDCQEHAILITIEWFQHEHTMVTIKWSIIIERAGSEFHKVENWIDDVDWMLFIYCNPN